MILTSRIITRKKIFLNLVQDIKQTGITNRLYSAKNAEELCKIWEDFQIEEEELITRVKEWGNEYIAIYEAGHNIFRNGEKVEDAMEIAICIYMMTDGGMEIIIFENENDLSDALGEIDNDFAKHISKLSYENTLKSIEAKDIFKS